MLSALRPPEQLPPAPPPPRMTSDPSELPPDRLHVEMELSPESHMTLYGPLLQALVSIKVYTQTLVSIKVHTQTLVSIKVHTQAVTRDIQMELVY